MAPQPLTPPPKVATILGAIGTLFVTLSVTSTLIKANRPPSAAGVFRIYKNWRRHSTEGVPGWMVFSWAVAMVPFGAYCSIQNLNMAIKVQPQLFCSLCLICWGQTLYYANKYKPWQAALTILGTGASFASIELILVFTLRIPYSKGINWPITALGIVGGILINLGLVAPFIDASKHDWRIIGVSFGFLSIDFAGAVFSLLSLCFQDTLDRYAAGSYITVMVLEIGICIIQCSWIVRKWSTIREARSEGKTFDEFVSGEDVVAKKERAEIMRSNVESRDWKGILSLSRMFAAMNRRHGEGKSMEDAEKGAHMTVREEDESKLTTTTGETLEFQEPQIPSLAYTSDRPPRRGSSGDLDSQAPTSG